MANVSIKFNKKDYLLSCDDGQEENLKELANHLDKKYTELRKDLGNIIQAYQEVARRLGIMHEESNISEVKFGKPQAVKLQEK